MVGSVYRRQSHLSNEEDSFSEWLLVVEGSRTMLTLGQYMWVLAGGKQESQNMVISLSLLSLPLPQYGQVDNVKSDIDRSTSSADQ